MINLKKDFFFNLRAAPEGYPGVFIIPPKNESVESIIF